ncbi:unnamed protein product [Ophioblennius macclurei]
MTWLPTNLHRATGMDTSSRKALLLLSVLLLSQLSCDAQTLSECCSQPSRSCRLAVLLCRSGGSGVGGALTGDASVGILTLGKRGEDEVRLQGRLHQLLHSSRNQAAGILTMGKRTGRGTGQQYVDWVAQSGGTMVTP